jgi:hypothetical protein
MAPAKRSQIVEQRKIVTSMINEMKLRNQELERVKRVANKTIIVAKNQQKTINDAIKIAQSAKKRMQSKKRYRIKKL